MQSGPLLEAFEGRSHAQSLATTPILSLCVSTQVYLYWITWLRFISATYYRQAWPLPACPVIKPCD